MSLGVGIGLRAPHYQEILETRPNVGWFEIISENFLEPQEKLWDMLESIRANTPILMHGVSLSIGSPDPLNETYLKKLKALADFLDTPWVSDHLCFTGAAHRTTHDLLPLPHTKEAIRHLAPRIRQVQEFLGRPLLLENPSTYLQFAENEMPEWEFLCAVAEESGCGILLDVNNIFVNSFNHGFDAKIYIHSVPSELVLEMHLSGHTHLGTHLLDTHNARVNEAVWTLYGEAVKHFPHASTLIEWDEDLPPLSVLLEEAAKASSYGLPQAA